MRSLGIVAVLVAAVLAACGPDIPEPIGSFDVDAADIEAIAATLQDPALDYWTVGETAYRSICSRCHAEDLGGGSSASAPPLDSMSDAAGEPNSFLRQTIERGQGRMPSFGGTLTPAQIDAVILYIRVRQHLDG